MMKVFGITLMLSHLSGLPPSTRGQYRVIVKSKSYAAMRRHLIAVGIETPMGYLRNHTAPTGNAVEVATATEEGAVYVRDLNNWDKPFVKLLPL